MHSILMESDKYAIHVLAQNQVAHGVHFSKPAVDQHDQFADIPHEMNEHVMTPQISVRLEGVRDDAVAGYSHHSRHDGRHDLSSAFSAHDR